MKKNTSYVLVCLGIVLTCFYNWKQTNKESNIEHYLDNLRLGCSEICNTNIKGKKSLYYDEIKKDVDCAGLWGNTAIDKPRTFGPAPDIPPEMIKYFSYNGRVKMLSYGKKLNEIYLGSNAATPVWDFDTIEQMKDHCSRGLLHGTYGFNETSRLFHVLKTAPGVQNGHVLVIGSERPWVESCALAAGASTVVTLEYGKIQSNHPQVTTSTPDEMRSTFKKTKLFDAIVTFSSIEHSGLGRYGDSLNPWGDLQAIARAWCIAKTGASLVIAVPDSKFSLPDDAIKFNAHRVYGPVMFSNLFANWKQVWRDDSPAPIDSQRIHLLQKY